MRLIMVVCQDLRGRDEVRVDLKGKVRSQPGSDRCNWRRFLARSLAIESAFKQRLVQGQDERFWSDGIINSHLFEKIIPLAIAVRHLHKGLTTVIEVLP